MNKVRSVPASPATRNTLRAATPLRARARRPRLCRRPCQRRCSCGCGAAGSRASRRLSNLRCSRTAPGARIARAVERHREVTVSSRTLGVHPPLGDDLAGQAGELLTSAGHGDRGCAARSGRPAHRRANRAGRTRMRGDHRPVAGDEAGSRAVAGVRPSPPSRRRTQRVPSLSVRCIEKPAER